MLPTMLKACSATVNSTGSRPCAYPAKRRRADTLTPGERDDLALDLFT